MAGGQGGLIPIPAEYRIKSATTSGRGCLGDEVGLGAQVGAALA